MPRRSAVAALLALAIACTACTAGPAGPAGSPGRSLPGPASTGGAGPGVITVGSFDFPESVLLAHLYAGALSARGYPVRVLPDLGSRELVEPALMTGLVQLVPEYTGSALEFVSLGRAHATADVAATAAALAEWMAARGIVTARPAAAQDANAIVVTSATRMYTFDGGCVTYQFSFAPGAASLLAIPVDTAVAFEPRADLVRQVRRTEGLALCGRGAAC